MVLTGIIKKGEGPGWFAGCDVIGTYTQGASRKDAAEQLSAAIETQIGRDGFAVRVTEAHKLGPDEYEVLIDSDQPELLAAEVLKIQRLEHKLTLAQVAERLGGSINNYAAYEQGTRAPSLAKFRELLAAVAPELALAVTARKGSAA